MNRVHAIGVAVLAFLATAGLVATTILIVTADPGGIGPPQPAVIDEDAYIPPCPECPPPTPPITRKQIQDIEALLRSDADLKRLLGQTSFSIEKAAPWVSGKTRAEREFIGALVYLDLSEPVSFHGSLPRVGYKPDPDSNKPYTSGQDAFQAEGILSLFVLVDLNEGLVASIEVNEAAEVIYEDLEAQRLINQQRGGTGQ